MTLRTRLMLLVAATLLPLLGLAFVSAVISARQSISQATSNLEFSASLVASNQQRFADSAHQLLISIVNTPALVEARQPDCRRYFKSVTEQLQPYINIGVIGANGSLLCDGVSLTAGAFVGDRAYFKAAMTSPGLVVSEFMLGRVSGVPVFAFALPVRDAQGVPAAVAFVTVPLGELSRALHIAPLPAGGRLFITDRNGIVILTNPANPALLGKPLASPTLQAAFKKGLIGVAEGPDPGASGEQQLYAFGPSTYKVGDQTTGDAAFFVAVSASKGEVLALSKDRLLLTLAALSLVSLLSGWIGWRVGNRAILLPANHILAAAARIQNGHLDTRISLATSDASREMTQIAEGFNLMAAALEQRERDIASELLRTRQTERKLLDAQKLGRMGNWEYDPSTQTLIWSAELYELFGIAAETFNGRHETFLQLIHPEDRVRYRAVSEQALAGAFELDMEYRIVTPAGVTRWMHQLGRSIPDDDGRLCLRAGVVQDITARKLAEMEITRNAELMERTEEMALIGGWELLIERGIVVCSEQVYRIHEVEPGRCSTIAEATSYYAPEAQAAIGDALRAGVEFGTAWDLTLPFITARGRRIHVRVQGRPIRQDGKTIRLVGVLQDVTEQYEARAHLTLLESAVSRLNDIVLITDVEPLGEGPRIVFVNDAFERRTGYSREEVLGKSPRFLQGPKTDRAELARMSAALASWQPVRCELINYTKAGEEYWLELDIVPLADSKGWFTHWVAVERDITQRKLAEQALVESEQRYTALFATAPMPMWVYDPVTLAFLTVNEAAIESYGYSLDEFLSMSIDDLHSDEEQILLEYHLSLGLPISGGRWRHRRKDGSFLTCQPLAKPVQYGSKPAQFVLALDVSAQARIEAEAQDQLQTLHRAAEAAQAITWHQQVGSTLQEAVEQARVLVGAHLAVITLCGADGSQRVAALSQSEKYAAVAAGAPAPPGAAGVNDLVSTGNKRAERMTAAMSPSGRSLLAVALIGRNSRNMGLLQLHDRYTGEFTLQDEYVMVEMAQLVATALENAQLFEEVQQLNIDLEQKVSRRTLALARQEALFRALVEQAPELIWTTDASGAVTFANQAWFKLVGGEAGDWEGARWLTVMHPEDQPKVRQLWQDAIANRSPFAGTRRLRASDGAYHSMSFRAVPVMDAAGEVAFWVGIDADITELTVIEAALRQSNKELEAFSYSVSHDLRSPLNTIDGFSRLLAKQIAGETGEKARHYLARIQAGVAQMGQLIEDLLSLAQVSRTQLKHEEVDLSELAQRVLDDWRARDPTRAVRLLVEPGIQTVGDGRLLRVVLENLIGNAWKFTSHQAAAAITFGATLDAMGQPVYFVRDNGAGFDMAYADKLFTPFQRLHAVSEFAGTGIGLATVSRVIERHGGSLWADAAPGKGATFSFTLPRRPLSV